MLLPIVSRAMTEIQQASTRNRLLKALSASDFAGLQPHLEPVVVELRQTLIVPNEPIKRLLFPESGYASVSMQGLQGDKVETGVIGREGLIGALPILLGSDRTPQHVFVQASGEMLSIDTRTLCRAIDLSPTLRRLLLRYTQVQIVEAAQTAFVNATYTMEVRLARWIVMCHDRVDSNELTMTHDLVSVMLGVQRSSATLAIQALEGRGLIKAVRGRMTVTDRLGLIGVADLGYGVPEAEYARLIESA